MAFVSVLVAQVSTCTPFTCQPVVFILVDVLSARSAGSRIGGGPFRELGRLKLLIPGARLGQGVLV